MPLDAWNTSKCYLFKILIEEKILCPVSESKVYSYWVLLVFNVTCNDISVIYVTAQMCRRIEEVVPTVGLPTP